MAAARLREAGCDAVVLRDPTTAVAPHNAMDSPIVLVVRSEEVETAAELLNLDRPDAEAEYLDALYHQRRFADRPTWIRYATWLLLLAIPGPFAVVTVWLLWTAMQSLFP